MISLGIIVSLIGMFYFIGKTITSHHDDMYMSRYSDWKRPIYASINAFVFFVLLVGCVSTLHLHS